MILLVIKSCAENQKMKYSHDNEVYIDDEARLRLVSSMIRDPWTYTYQF